jgi:hypothetical protein
MDLLVIIGKDRSGDKRIVELGHLRETVYHLICPWPGEIGRVVFWSGVYVGGGVLDDEIAVFLLKN